MACPELPSQNAPALLLRGSKTGMLLTALPGCPPTTELQGSQLWERSHSGWELSCVAGEAISALGECSPPS